VRPYDIRRAPAVARAGPDSPQWAHAVAAFWRKHRSVIYKSVSGVRSIVSQLGPSDLEHLEDVMTCPTQFQQYVDGTDFRVHVVGGEVFGCEVQSAADDYRYAAKAGEPDACLRAYEVPEELAERCREMTAELGLSVAGIDLRRTPDGRWVCFEVNPSPAFTYY
jgi:glutathione synthase/RimK-type ligase-like ATP-grasp enzyme